MFLHKYKTGEIVKWDDGRRLEFSKYEDALRFNLNHSDNPNDYKIVEEVTQEELDRRIEVLRESVVIKEEKRAGLEG